MLLIVKLLKNIIIFYLIIKNINKYSFIYSKHIFKFISIFFYKKKIDFKYCNICEKKYKHGVFGYKKKRTKALCLHCLSLKRNQLMIARINNTTKSKKHPKVLYFSGNKFQKKILEKYGFDVKLSRYYIKKERIDITNIKNGSFYNIVVSEHVMEHLKDDLAGFKEVFKILEKDGIYFVSFPININNKYTDEKKRNIFGRVKYYGQHDHLRIYGQDIIEKVKNIGFNVTLVSKKEFGSYDNYIYSPDEFCLILKK
jgi:hypothetical protein